MSHPTRHACCRPEGADRPVTHVRSLRTLLSVARAGLLRGVAGCAGQGSTDAADPPSGSSSSVGPQKSATPSASPKPKKKHYPKGPPMLLDGIAPLSDTTVGVAMPLSISFTDPVKAKARKRIEQAIELKT